MCYEVLILTLLDCSGTVAIIMFRIEIPATWWSLLMLKRIKTLLVNGIWLSTLILHINLIIPRSIDHLKVNKIYFCNSYRYNYFNTRDSRKNRLHFGRNPNCRYVHTQSILSSWDTLKNHEWSLLFKSLIPSSVIMKHR